MAPSPESAATTASAGRNPEVKLAAVPRWPLAVKTAAASAIANAPPNRCSVLFTPEAFPMSCGETALTTAVAAIGSAIEMPTPATISGTTNPA